jgi:hypothetical protein
MHMGTGRAANTSVIGSRVEIDRKTMFGNVTIRDWNIQMIEGTTSTGTHNPGRFNLALSKSLAGTGALVPMGSVVIGTAADGTVVDAALTPTNLVGGDDLILSYEVGTSLPADTLRVEADVEYIQHFV